MTIRPLVVHYDIGDDARRAKVVAALRPVAAREQQSVWIVAPTARLHPGRVLLGLVGLIDEGDRLLVHAPCADCLGMARCRSATPDPFGWYRPQVVGA